MAGEAVLELLLEEATAEGQTPLRSYSSNAKVFVNNVHMELSIFHVTRTMVQGV